MRLSRRRESSDSLGDILCKIVTEARGVPVFAAGGISNRSDVLERLTQGATGCVVGTRFLVASESWAHDEYKQLLTEQSEIALTTCFCEGWENAPHRVLKNSTYRHWEALGSAPKGLRPREGNLAHSAGGVPIERYSVVVVVFINRTRIEFFGGSACNRNLIEGSIFVEQ